MWRRPLILALIFLLAPTSASAGTVSSGCNPPERTELLWQQTDLRFLILGEFHGTAEIPAAFSEMVCAGLSSGREVLVGLEFPEATSSAFKAYLNSPGSPADRNRLIDDAFKDEDGTASQALFEIVERVRQWRQEGAPLSLATFQPKAEYDPALGQTPYEKGMAAALMEAAAQHPDALVLVLVGNIHARKKPFGGDAYPAFEPMAMHLPPRQTLALVAVHEGGDSWDCRETAEGPHDCGRHIQVATKLGRDAPPGLKLGLEPSAAYDGFVKLGKLTASPPVKPYNDE